MKVITSKTDAKKRRRDDTQDAISESPKRAKVHAQRKFAQGAAYNAPAITIIKDKVRPPTNINAPGLMLSSKRPNTEDFLTFLCFRRTKILPAKLDFFKDAFKHQPIQSSYTQKTSDSVSIYKNHAAKSLIKQNPKKTDKTECVKKAQTPVQALRRKYQEQRLAKQNPTNVTKLAQKVKGKNMMRTRSSALQEENAKPVKKIVLLKERKAPLSGLRSGLQRSPPEAPKNVKKTEKFIVGKNLRSRFKGTIINKKSGIKGAPLKKPGSKNLSQEEPAKRMESNKNVKNTEMWTRTRGMRANIKKAEGFSDFSSDENEPLLTVRKGKPGLRTRQTANEIKKETKTNTIKTKSQVTEVAQVSVRPTRKTKEAAAIYMEMITKKLVSPEKSGDDDRSSVDSFPELPSARRNEQRESEIKAKAMAVRKSIANESKSNAHSEDKEKGGKLSNNNSRRKDIGKRNDILSKKVGSLKNCAKENQLSKSTKELPKRIIRDLSKRPVKNLPPKKITKENSYKKVMKEEPPKKLVKEEPRGKLGKEEETKKIAKDENVKKLPKDEQIKKEESVKKNQDGAAKKMTKGEIQKKVVNDDAAKKIGKEVSKRNLKEESPKKCLKPETVKKGSQNDATKKISKEETSKKSPQEDLPKKTVKDESSKKSAKVENVVEKTGHDSAEEKIHQPEGEIEGNRNGGESEDRLISRGKKQEEPEIKQERMAEKANGVKKSNSFSKKGSTGGQTISCTSSSPQEKMVSSLVEAPTFYPTEKEFQDPLEFFERIRPAAENFGLCRIVPPSTFKPDCKVSDDMRFTAYNQYVHRMFHRWGPNIKEMMAIKKYLATQSISLKQPPWIGSIEVDLPRLYQCVQNCGGLMKVMEKKKWHQVADMMRIPKAAQDRVTKLDDIYCKYLLPYDTLSHEERQKLFDEVENDWLKRQENTTDSADEDSEEEFYIDECEECIVKGRNMALNQFYRIARNTMSMWFKTQEPTPSEVENEFWRHVSERTNHVCVHSGSIDSSGWGYGFPVAKNNSFSKHPWNLKVLTNNSGSILRSLGPVMGVTVPTLHVGMVFTAFCWYRDPHGLPWVEYLHTGAPKIWYGISDDNSSLFKEALTKLLPRYIKNKKKIWLPSDTAMVPPALLADHGVSLCHTIQKPGQFILVFPRAFTSSICTGYLVSESVYFARPSWLTTAEQVFRDIRDCCEPTMFSLEKLLFSIATDTRSSVEVLKQVLPMVCHIKESEIEARKILWELGLKTWERLPVKDQSGNRKKGRRTQDEEGDYECIVCSMNLCVSLVMNSQEEGVLCLRHAIDLLTQKKSHLKYCRLMFGYTQEELCELVEKLEQKIESKSQKRIQSRPSSASGK